MRACAVAAIATLFLIASGCIDASRVNAVCRWTDDAARPLDLRQVADREHLRQDVQVAWEVGLRFADVRYRNNPRLSRPLLDQCRRALYDSIVARHRVSRADIVRATYARVWWIDVVVVFVPVTILMVLVMDLITKRVRRGFDSDDRIMAALSTAAFAGLVALVATGLMQTWAMIVESLRLRDGHISGRAFVLPANVHAGMTLSVLLVVCAAVALRRSARTPLRS